MDYTISTSILAPNKFTKYRGGGGGATAIERWTPCSNKKTRKKGRFSRTGDVRAYGGKGIKIVEIWKKRYREWNRFCLLSNVLKPKGGGWEGNSHPRCGLLGDSCSNRFWVRYYINSS